MSCTVVVDGGGTGCRLAAVNESGKLVAQVISTPANLTLGADQVYKSITNGLASLAVSLGKPAGWHPETIWCGLAGSHQIDEKEQFLQKLSNTTTCHIINDGYAQLLGCAQGETPYACLSIGTGSVLNYLDSNGQHSMQGGWGFPAGDEGSGAWVGLRAVNRLAQWYDTKSDFSKTPPLIEGLVDIIEPTIQGILKFSTSKDPKQLAQLAPIVFETAPRDKSARDIITEGTQHFQNLIAESSSGITTCVAGGLAKSYQPYLEALLKRDISIAPTEAALHGLHLYARQAETGLK